MFHHVDAFRPTPSQSPREQGPKHRSAILQGLIVDKFYLFYAGPWIEWFFENGISHQSGAINNNDNPDSVVRQCMFKVPFQDFARADGYYRVPVLSLQLFPEVIETIVEILTS